MSTSLNFNRLKYFRNHNTILNKTRPIYCRSFSQHHLKYPLINRSTCSLINYITLLSLRKDISHSSLSITVKYARNSESVRYLSNTIQSFKNNKEQGLNQNRTNLTSLSNSPLDRDEDQIKQHSSFHLVSQRNDKTKNSSSLSTDRLVSKGSTHLLARKAFKMTEGDWKRIWAQKFKKYILLGQYSPDSPDKLLFSYLNAKKQTLKSKYTFNEFVSRSHIISYHFNKNINKIDLNTLYKILQSFFKKIHTLISYPALEISPDKIKIRLFYYVLPSLTKKRFHQILHRYIRSDEKLYKELILRKKFQSIMHKFKLTLFIAKWKEENLFINVPRPISFFKGLSVLSTPSEISLENLNKGPIYLNVRRGRDLYSASSVASGPEGRAVSELPGLGEREERNTTVRSQPISLDLIQSDVSGTSVYSLNLNLKQISQRYAELNRGFNLTQSRHEDLDNVTSGGDVELKRVVDGLVHMDKALLLKSTTDQCKLSSLSMRQPCENESNHRKTQLSLFNSEEERLSIDSLQIKTLKAREVSSIVSLNKEKFKYFLFILEKWFKKTVILELVRLKYPYHESNILAQVLALSSKMKNFREIMIKILFTIPITNPKNRVIKQTFSTIPSYLSGLKVTLAGRLKTQRIVPRFTVQSFQVGSLARGKIQFRDSSRITLKNKRGAFSFTVSTSHIFDE